MKKEDIIKQLVPGFIVGIILGFTITMLVGVDETNIIPNYIGGAVCCIIPTLLNTIIVLKGTAKTLKREISIGKAFGRALPYTLLSGVIGLFTVAVIVERVLGINPCEISRVATAVYEAILGAVVSTVLAYFALKKYDKQVKYTRRTKK